MNIQFLNMQGKPAWLPFHSCYYIPQLFLPFHTILIIHSYCDTTNEMEFIYIFNYLGMGEKIAQRMTDTLFCTIFNTVDTCLSVQETV